MVLLLVRVDVPTGTNTFFLPIYIEHLLLRDIIFWELIQLAISRCM